ncbi:hypothetical protein [Bacteroides sp.]|uniref:hypothetical protein n=1 Tax=Bacteroides sp. TaxID=29523 RepID=UPI0025C7330C|nr:hypothetical protein [Bacteroides sp.]
MKFQRFIVPLIMVLLASCGQEEKKASDLLMRAEQSYSSANYNEAKMQIDSIRNLYPKVFDVRKKAIRLKQQVELKEQQISLEYLDSMMTIKKILLDSMKVAFVLEKDTAYQEIGNYFYPTQVVEKNIGRTFLRACVSERGEMSITSIYCAGGSLNHTSVKVSSKDAFAQTPASPDVYVTTDLGKKIEKADYKLGADGGVIGFIIANKDAKSLKLEFIGDRTYKTLMYSQDIKAIVELSKLAQVLLSIEEIKKEQKEANLKIQFLNKKIAEFSVEE